MWILTKIMGPLRKWLLLSGAVLVAFGVVALKAYNAGVKSEKGKQKQRSLEVLRKRMKVNAKVDAADSDTVRDRLRDDWK